MVPQLNKIQAKNKIFFLHLSILLGMRIHIIYTGKTKDRIIVEAIKEYWTRLGHFISITQSETEDIKGLADAEAQRKKEAHLQLKQITTEDRLVLLDEKGKSFTSKSFAKWISLQADQGCKRLVFIIGGAYGFDQSVIDRAQQLISLSPMTFTHQMVRLIFAEQLYRAFTIINRLPYHHE